MRTELAKAQRRLDASEQRHHIQMFDSSPVKGTSVMTLMVPHVSICVSESGSRGFRVIFSPDLLELVQMMWTKKRPVTGQVVEVVHDDSDKQVEDLRKQYRL